jgi:hypothetical protein
MNTKDAGHGQGPLASNAPDRGGTPLFHGYTETEYLFARVCCNALLIGYKLAEPVQSQRALALLSAMAE